MLHDIVLKGSTDRSVTVRIIDSTDGTPETGVVFNTSGIDLWYRREGAALTSITEATLAALTTAHSDGGFLHVANGVYRLDLPDAAFASGANYVDFGGTVTGMIVIGGRVRLVDVNLEDTVRAGLTALPNAAAAASGGLFTRGTGAGQINQDANGRIDVNVAAISTDTTAADNCELMFDGTGYAGGTAKLGVDVVQISGDAAAADNLEAYSDGTTPQPVNVTQFGGSAGTFASGIPAVNATQISGDATAADNLETSFDDTAGAVPWMGILDQGTAQSATATTVVLRSAAAFADDTLIGATIGVFGSTQGYWQFGLITDNVLSTDTVTVATWPVTPSGTITYKIFGTAPSSGGGSGLDAAGVRAAIGLASANLDTQLSTIDTVVDAILVDTGTTLDARIPAALVSGRMDVSVGAMAANVMTAAAAAADLTTELQSGLATAASLSTVAGYLDTEVAAILAAVDTEVAAIKAKTDSLTFTVAGVVDANIQSINDVTITGNGQAATKFGV